MDKLRELYQELILDHGRSPRNFHAMPEANFYHEGFNPLCGDRVLLYIQEQDGVMKALSFQGCGCAISMASTSLMTEALCGKSIAEAQAFFDDFHDMVKGKVDEVRRERLGKLSVLAGVAEYPTRVKCAILAWHTMKAALAGSTQTITTEDQSYD